MTKEEAIRQIENRWNIMDYGESEALGEALDMAIEALTEQSLINKDAVSREGLLKSWEELSPRGRTEFDQVIMTIPALPSADAVPHKVIANIKVDTDEIIKRIKEEYVFKDEVMQCKDCIQKHIGGSVTHYYWCDRWDMEVDDTDYCAWGERREP